MPETATATVTLLPLLPAWLILLIGLALALFARGNKPLLNIGSAMVLTGVVATIALTLINEHSLASTISGAWPGYAVVGDLPDEGVTAVIDPQNQSCVLRADTEPHGLWRALNYFSTSTWTAQLTCPR